MRLEIYKRKNTGDEGLEKHLVRVYLGDFDDLFETTFSVAHDGHTGRLWITYFPGRIEVEPHSLPEKAKGSEALKELKPDDEIQVATAITTVEYDKLKTGYEKLEAIKKAFINQFTGLGFDVINNEDFEAAENDPKCSYYFANATRKILGVEGC